MIETSAINVTGLRKTYRLFTNARDRLKEAFHPAGKCYHQPFDALKNIDLSIAKGETVGIIGKNGSGKSTLLQCICGIAAPSEGSINVDGKIAALLELGAGFNPEFTGRENLYLNASILGLSREQTDDRLADILAFADIGEYIDQPVRTYSSGMYVRLAFAIAIHVDPEILIVDEALAVGDVHFQSKCFERFHRFREQGVTVIFVTHDLNMVTRYCDRAYLLERGQIVAQGEPRDVVAMYRKSTVDHAKPDGDCEPEVSENSVFETNPYETRYGNDKATIVEAGIYDESGNPVQVIHYGDAFTVRLKVRFNDSVEEPIYAFTIKDVRGTEIAGHNTHLEKTPTKPFARGEIAEIAFRQSMYLTAGNYLLSLGCVSHVNDQIEVHDRRHDYLSFDVVSDRAALGLVDLQPQISIFKVDT
ncbi:MAG: ABC transporter ATP-binding protein [Pseudomonadota bacterium]